MLPEDWRGMELDALSAHQPSGAGVIANG
jgi:hypothetical protein